MAELFTELGVLILMFLHFCNCNDSLIAAAPHKTGDDHTMVDSGDQTDQRVKRSSSSEERHFRRSGPEPGNVRWHRWNRNRGGGRSSSDQDYDYPNEGPSPNRGGGRWHGGGGRHGGHRGGGRGEGGGGGGRGGENPLPPDSNRQFTKPPANQDLPAIPSNIPGFNPENPDEQIVVNKAPVAPGRG